MLFGRNTKLKDTYTTPIFGTVESNKDIPKFKMNEKAIPGNLAYQLIKDELIDEGKARQNLATFCQTYMEDEATKLMSETLQKNAIDKSEYPQTTELENRCVNILADLWNAPAECEFMGTSTVGSSEACMLAGLAMKFKWRKQAERLGVDLSLRKPNIVISSAYQVCWEKFCVYFDVELRTVPITEQDMTLNIDEVMDYVDEYTIGIVGIFGVTYTGKFDDIEALDKAVERYNSKTEHKVYIHVDAASGGLFVPFIDPKLKWDFRLKNVISINSSGHKYGLVYPGIGWVLWKDREYLPSELVFKVNYLGGEMPTMAINFSRSASNIVAQYYNFLRFGFEGYHAIHQRTKDVALFISSEIEETGLFDIYNRGENLPVVCYKLRDDADVKWSLYDLSDRLAMKGWQVPTYPLPEQLTDVVVQRIVCRSDFTRELADLFIRDFCTAIKDLNNAHVLVHSKGKYTYGFTH